MIPPIIYCYMRLKVKHIQGINLIEPPRMWRISYREVFKLETIEYIMFYIGEPLFILALNSCFWQCWRREKEECNGY